MTRRSIVLMGGPDSGKTNYIARLWPSFKRRKGALRAEHLPDDIAYVDSAVEYLMQGSFAPRSDRNLEVGRADFSISVRAAGDQGEMTELMVPDISGELWTRMVATFEISQEWLDVLNDAEGAIIFVRVHSDLIVKPLDWVTARSILELEQDGVEAAAEEAASDVGGEGDERQPDENVSDGVQTVEGAPSGAEGEDTGEQLSQPDLPTQVLLCELLRYLNQHLADRSDGGRPHVAIVVAAWDLLDSDARAAGPMVYLRKEFPLFAGRLADTGRLAVKLFGLSIVGGDLADDDRFREEFVDKDVSEEGWVVVEDHDGLRIDTDVMLPIAWAMGV